eukprot:4249686-Prymnesium_polylepis.1
MFSLGAIWAHAITCSSTSAASRVTHSPESFAAEIRFAMREGLHLQPCHEFPSVIDPGSGRHALEFKQIMDAPHRPT